MTVRLIYHNPDSLPGTVSPFDRAILSIAPGERLRLACPYINLRYLRRIILPSASWQLLTDVEEWLGSQDRARRKEIFAFLKRHCPLIRHYPKLHAKVAIGPQAAILGSANFTDSGMTERAEVSALLEDEPQVQELAALFDALWEEAYELPPLFDRIAKYMKTLPKGGATGHASNGLHLRPLSAKATLVPTPKPILESTQEVEPGTTETQYWCLNFDDDPEILEHGLTNNMWMMQYEYKHDGKDYQGGKISQIARNWKSAARIKPGDWCLAYMKRNKFYAVGRVIAPRKEATHEDTVKRTLDKATKRHHPHYQGIVHYTDSAGAFYEDRDDNRRFGPKRHPYPQRVDVEKWLYADRRGDDYVPQKVGGLKGALRAFNAEAPPNCKDLITAASFRITREFFRKIEERLQAGRA